MPKKYRHRQAEIDTEQWDGTSGEAVRIIKWITDNGGKAKHGKFGATPTIDVEIAPDIFSWVFPAGVVARFASGRWNVYDQHTLETHWSEVAVMGDPEHVHNKPQPKQDPLHMIDRRIGMSLEMFCYDVSKSSQGNYVGLLSSGERIVIRTEIIKPEQEPT